MKAARSAEHTTRIAGMGCNEHEQVNGVPLATEASLKDIRVNLPRLMMTGSAVFGMQIFSRATSLGRPCSPVITRHLCNNRLSFLTTDTSPGSFDNHSRCLIRHATMRHLRFRLKSLTGLQRRKHGTIQPALLCISLLSGISGFNVE